jgi:phosphoserine phosphatase
MGVLQALNKTGGPFDADDEELARVLSAQAGVALHRHALLEEYAEKQRMTHDLELARTIQQRLFPKTNPTLPDYEVAGWNRCADETGGDFYDFIRLDDSRQVILLADATGHGIGAALVMAQCRSLTRAMFSVTDDLRRVAATVNRLLSEDLTDDRFVTAFVGVLDTRRHRLDYIAAGQGPLLFVAGNAVEQRGANALPLAIVPDFESEPAHYVFEPGATVILLTDGFYETADPTGVQFGEQRIVDLTRRHHDAPLMTLIGAMHDAVCRFRQTAAQADDLTAVLIRRNR